MISRTGSGGTPVPRISILSAGTEGDIRPLAALGAALAGAGHPVTLAADPEYAPLAGHAGLRFRPLAIDMRRLVAELGDRPGGGRLGLLRAVVARLADLAPDWARDGLAATEGAGLVIGSGGATWLAASLAERSGAGFVRANLQPLEPDRSVGPLLLEPMRVPVPGVVRLALHHAVRAAAWQAGRRPIGGVRRALGLPAYPALGPWHGAPNGRPPILNGFSRLLAPGRDGPGTRTRTVGAWSLPASSAPPPPDALVRFLEAGPPPVFLGFGSMRPGDRDATVRILVSAARGLGRRVVLSGGWGGLGAAEDEADDLIRIGPVSHDWLFPRVAAAIHHCGAGTTHAACRAGIPSVPVPCVLDQFFWASRLRALGVAPAPLRRPTPSLAAAAIARALSPAAVERAARLGEAFRREDAAAGALDALAAWGLLAAPPGTPDRRRA